MKPHITLVELHWDPCFAKHIFNHSNAGSVGFGSMEEGLS